MPRVAVQITGDEHDFLRANNASREAAKLLGKDLKQLAVDAKTSAAAQVQASIRKQSRLREEAAAAHQLAATYKRGSLEQRTAAELATRADQRLAKSIGLTSRESAHFARNAAHSERELSHVTRGALAGSGIFRGLGRSIAFASGGFLAFASLGELGRKSIDAAAEEAAVERQLAAQFRASRTDLALYRGEIDKTGTRLSALSGFTKDDLTQSFTTAFRGTKNVGVSLKEEAIAADVARGRHISLAQATIAETKAYLGQATALRRLGIQIPKNLKGMAALNFLQAKFAGQAKAGTTDQQRFAAELHNTEVTIGSALTPSLNRYLGEGSRWLGQAKNQQRIQRDVNETVRISGSVLHGLASAFHVAVDAVSPFVRVVGGAKNAAELAGLAFLVMKARTAALALGLSKASVQALTLRARLLGLSKIGPIAIAVIVGFEAAGPLKDFFTKHLGANFKGPQAAGDLVPVLKNGVFVDPNTGKRLPNQKVAASLARQQFSGPVNNEDVRLRGAGSINTAIAPGALAHPRASLSFQLSLNDLKLAKAEQTATDVDDRALLTRRIALLKQLAAKTKDLATRISLNQEIVSVEGQVTSIDQARAAKEKQAHDAEVAAAKKRAREREQHQKKLEALAKKQAALEKKQADAEKRRFQDAQRTFASALDTARSTIGTLFSGPVLQPTDSQRMALLGVPGPSAKNLTADLHAQVAQAKRFDRDLAKLKRQGASPELLKELRGQGTAALPQIEALTGGKASDRNAFFGQFAQREKLAHSEATMAVSAKNVHIRAVHASIVATERRAAARTEREIVLHSHTHLDSREIAHTVTKHQDRSAKNRSSQSRGRQPGR